MTCLQFTLSSQASQTLESAPPSAEEGNTEQTASDSANSPGSPTLTEEAQVDRRVGHQQVTPSSQQTSPGEQGHLY